MGWIFGLFRTVQKKKISGLFSESPKLKCETEFLTILVYSSVCIATMNNMIMV